METIIALLMFVGAEQKLIEMTYMPSVKVCLEKRRISTRNSNATFMCSKVKGQKTLSPAYWAIQSWKKGFRI